jgi:hypothetical protein
VYRASESGLEMSVVELMMEYMMGSAERFSLK